VRLMIAVNVHFRSKNIRAIFILLEKCKMSDISWRHNLLVYPFIQNKKSEVYESWRVGSEIKGFPPPFPFRFRILPVY